MPIALYQIAIIVIAAVMIGHGIRKFFRHEEGQTLLKLGVRVIIWGSMAAVVAFPRLTNLAASIIGIENNVNAAVLAGFLLVFLMIFKLLSAIERLEQQMTLLTRKDALTGLKQDEKHE
jgi:hypothetical protein